MPCLSCSPGDVQGFLYHAELWEVLNVSVHPLSPVLPAAESHVPSTDGGG